MEEVEMIWKPVPIWSKLGFLGPTPEVGTFRLLLLFLKNFFWSVDNYRYESISIPTTHNFAFHNVSSLKLKQQGCPPSPSALAGVSLPVGVSVAAHFLRG